MKVALQGFRAAAVVPMEYSTILAATAAGGVLQRAMRQMPGSATWTMSMAMFTGSASIRGLGFLFVVSGIDTRYLSGFAI